MNPLYLAQPSSSITIKDKNLVITDLKNRKVLYSFPIRQIPYDSIIIQRNQGYITYAAINWIVKHAVSLTILNWRGNILGQFFPSEPISNELKVAQYQAYLNREKHLVIAKRIVETKIQRQKEFLASLSQNYLIEFPKLSIVRMPNSTDFIRNVEARYAVSYFIQFGKVCKEIGYDFKGRNLGTKSNMHAVDLPNGLLNYGYSILQTYLRRAINSIGLDYTIPFLHDLRPNSGLVYDLMELWRTNIDYSVLQTLEKFARTKKSYFISDNYEVVLHSETVKELLERVRLNLSLDEILRNCRIFSAFLLGKTDNLSFNLKQIEIKQVFENERVKQLILTKTARELGMTKSSHFYQRQRLKERGSIRLYGKTKQYYA